MKFLLKLKHWQIFIIWILLAVIFTWSSNSSIWIITFLIYMISLIGWIYSIGKITNSLNEKYKLINQKEDLWFILYLITTLPFGYFYINLEYGNVNPLIIIIPGIIGLISIIKLVNFSAKAFKQNELKNELKFKDYENEFFLILFLIIGVWIIQPRLNKMIKKYIINGLHRAHQK